MTARAVTVVMPAYNAETTIGAAVSSVLSQDHPSVELVVVDDGSTDGTAEIASAHGPRVRVIHQENRGVAAARNAGIEAATSDLIAFCDSDDFLFERHLSALVATHEANEGGIATANSYWLLPGGIHHSKQRYKGRFPKPEEQRRAILEQNFVSTLSLFPRALWEQIGRFDEGRRRAEDWDFWLRAIYAGARVSLQREPLALYRWSTQSLSSDWRAMDADIESIYDAIEERVRLSPAELDYVRRRRNTPGPRVLSREGDASLRAGRYHDAARAYRDAATLCPSERMLVWKARALMPMPRITGPVLRARQLRIERSLGMEEGHTR